MSNNYTWDTVRVLGVLIACSGIAYASSVQSLDLVPAEVNHSSLPRTQENLNEVIAQSQQTVSKPIVQNEIAAMPKRQVITQKKDSVQLVKAPSQQSTDQRDTHLNQVLNQIPQDNSENNTNAAMEGLVRSTMGATTPSQDITSDYKTPMTSYQFYQAPGIQVGAEHSSEFGTIVNTKLGYQFNDQSAVVLEGDAGAKEYRLGLTWAYMPTAHQRMKLTVEHLAQKMKFDYITGSDQTWIHQEAVGGEYDYLFSRTQLFHQITLNTLGISGYYSKAADKKLSSTAFESDGTWYWNRRRITGGQSDGFQFHMGLSPWQWASLKLGLGYSSVNYDRHYESDKSESGLAGSVNLAQVLTNQLKFQVGADWESAYNDYMAGISYLVHTRPGSQLELGLHADRIQGHTGLGKDIRVGMTVGYTWDSHVTYPKNHKIEPTSARHYFASGNLLNWAMTPAVHMDKVLAIKDEKTEKVGPASSGTIPDVWATVGHSFSYNAAKAVGFVPGNDGGSLKYLLMDPILKHAFKNTIDWLTVDRDTGVVSSSTIPENATDRGFVLKGTKYADGHNTGITTQGLFRVYIEPTSTPDMGTFVYHYFSAIHECFIQFDAAEQGNFNSHGGSLKYELKTEGESQILSINPSTGFIQGTILKHEHEKITVSAYKEDIPNGALHKTTSVATLECQAE